MQEIEDQKVAIFAAFLALLCLAQSCPSVWLAWKIGWNKGGIFNKSAALIILITGELGGNKYISLHELARAL